MIVLNLIDINIIFINSVVLEELFSSKIYIYLKKKKKKVECTDN